MRHLYKVFLSSILMSATIAFAVERPPGTNEAFPVPHRVRTISEQKWAVGINGGIATTENRATGTSYGIQADFQPYVPFGLGLEVGGSTNGNRNANAAVSRTRILFRGTYNLGGSTPVIRYSYLGVGLGPILDNIAGKTSTEFGVAPMVGFDIPVGGDEHMSLGLNASYLFVGSAKPDTFAVNGVAKYLF